MKKGLFFAAFPYQVFENAIIHKKSFKEKVWRFEVKLWDVKFFVWIVLGSESKQFAESKDLLNHSKVGLFWSISANFRFDLWKVELFDDMHKIHQSKFSKVQTFFFLQGLVLLQELPRRRKGREPDKEVQMQKL